MAGTMASMPVAAVTGGGRPSVSSGSRMAQSGRSRAETTPFFSVVGVVTMAMGVPSEPVPAGGGAPCGAVAGGGGREQKGRALSLGQPDAIDVVEPVLGAGQVGHELR